MSSTIAGYGDSGATLDPQKPLYGARSEKASNRVKYLRREGTR